MGPVAEVERRRIRRADLGQGALTGGAVKIDRHPELGPDPLAQGTRQLGCLRQRTRAEGHDRDHVSGPAAGMDAGVAIEVDRLDRERDRREEPVQRIAAGQGQHDPVVVRVEGAVEDMDAARRGGTGEAVDDGRVPALGEVRHRFEERHRQRQAE